MITDVSGSFFVDTYMNTLRAFIKAGEERTFFAVAVLLSFLYASDKLFIRFFISVLNSFFVK